MLFVEKTGYFDKKRYRQEDRDGDGKKAYAAFHVHLYQSVAPDGKPVPMGLISRDLGFAMTRRLALDGYVYHSLHAREELPACSPLAKASTGLNPAREWAVAATPAAWRWSGMLFFVADSTGAIWTAPRPEDPAATEVRCRWRAVASLEQLEQIQRSVAYPARATSR